MNVLLHIKIALSMLPANWFVQDGIETIIFYVQHHSLSEDTDKCPVTITRSLAIRPDHTWVAHINGLRIPSSSSVVCDIPEILSTDAFIKLLDWLKSYNVCTGNLDNHFVTLCEQKQGRFLSAKNDIVAFLHDGTEMKTVRHSSCELLVATDSGTKCAVCWKYHNDLRAMYSHSRQKHNLDSAKANDRFLCTPQRRKRMITLRRKIRNLAAKNRRLRSKLDKITATSGVITDSQLESDMLSAIDQHQDYINELPKNDSCKVFWEQQVLGTMV